MRPVRSGELYYATVLRCSRQSIHSVSYLLQNLLCSSKSEQCHVTELHLSHKFLQQKNV